MPTQPGCAAVCWWLPSLSGLQDPWHHLDWQCRGLCWGGPILDDCTQTHDESRKNHHHPAHPSERDIFTGTFSISAASISVTPVARNLGVLWDSRLSMKAHVNEICCASYMRISNISAICRMLTREAAETLVHAFVSSWLDYRNSLYGLPASSLNKLHRIQNHAAWVVTGAWKYHWITPVLHELHWLPMSQRIIFKLLTLTCQIMHRQAPMYLCELAIHYWPGCTLHSTDDPTHQAELHTHGNWVRGSQFHRRRPLPAEWSASQYEGGRVSALFQETVKNLTLWVHIRTVIWTFSWVG